MKKRWRTVIIAYIILGFGAFAMLIPYWWMVAASFEDYEQIMSFPPKFVPSPPTFDNYRELFESYNFGRILLNTFIVTMSIVLGQLVLCSMAAYAFARLDFPGKDIIFTLYLAVLMIPGVILLISKYLVVKHLGWLDTMWAIVVPELFSAFGTFFLRQYFTTIPIELDEAAIIDGASPWQILTKIIIPLAVPALSAYGIIAFLFGWNMFLWPLVVIMSEDKYVLSIALATLQSAYDTNWSVIMAGSVIASIPTLIVFLLGQKYFIKGIAGGLKF